jgi:anaerobic glycerol-3-phosphate dehydrogenase
MSERRKVVIVGGGFGGLSAAQHLHSNSRRTVLSARGQSAVNVNSASIFLSTRLTTLSTSGATDSRSSDTFEASEILS